MVGSSGPLDNSNKGSMNGTSVERTISMRRQSVDSSWTGLNEKTLSNILADSVRIGSFVFLIFYWWVISVELNIYDLLSGLLIIFFFSCTCERYKSCSEETKKIPTLQNYPSQISVT